VTSVRAVRRRRIGAFGHRNYRLFFGGQAVSLVGTWMQQVAQAWLVLQVSGGDPFWLGVVAAAQFLPSMVLGLFAGVLADSLPKRQTLIAAQFAMMGLAIVLTILSAAGIVEIWMVVVLALLLGCANAVDMPVRQSFAIEMVGPDDVGNAVTLNSAMFNGARVVGPAVAGLTIGAFGVTAAFGINAISFLAVIIALALMNDEELIHPRLIPRPRSARDVFTNLAEGLRFVRGTPVVLMAVSVVGLVATFGMNFNVLVPPLAQDVLHSDAAGYGFLMTASGLGALSAAIVLVVGGRPRPIRIGLGGIVLGVASIALALSGSFPVSLILMAIIGAGGITMAATANATIQLSVPDGLRGRVMSVYTTVFAGSVPVGGLAMGALASVVGIPITFAVGGVLSLATGLIAFVWWRRVRSGWTGVLPSSAPPEPVDVPTGVPAGVPGGVPAGVPGGVPAGVPGAGTLQAGDLAPNQLTEAQAQGYIRPAG
jgi:MFS family permease